MLKISFQVPRVWLNNFLFYQSKPSTSLSKQSAIANNARLPSLSLPFVSWLQWKLILERERLNL